MKLTYIIAISLLSCLLFTQCTKKDSQLVCSNGPYIYRDGADFLVLLTAFTPNYDKLNDQFVTFANFTPANFHLAVYWSFNMSKPVYETTDIHASWNGENKNRQVYPGYNYYVKTHFTDTKGNEINICSPLFIIIKTSNCGSNARASDKDKYLFQDQVDPATGKSIPYTKECLNF